MTYKIITLLLICLAFSQCKAGQPKATPTPTSTKIEYSAPSKRVGNQEFSPSTLIIFYDDSIGKAPLLKAVKEYKATIIYQYGTMNGIAIRIPEGKSIDDAIAYFQKVKGVLAVNRDRICHLDNATQSSASPL